MDNPFEIISARLSNIESQCKIIDTKIDMILLFHKANHPKLFLELEGQKKK